MHTRWPVIVEATHARAAVLLFALVALGGAARADDRRDCRRDDADACLRVGQAMRTMGPPRAARKWYRRACEQTPRACGPWLTHFDRGEARIDAAQVACDGGHAWSCNELGRYYAHFAPERWRDDARAMSLFDAACTGGDGHGCVNAAQQYLDGNEAVTRDPMEATRYFLAACDLHHEEACVPVADRLIDGAGIGRDVPRAYATLEGSCGRGHLPACETRGRWQQEGRGAPADPAAAMVTYAGACAAGSMSSCAAAVGLVRDEGVPGTEIAAALSARCGAEHHDGCGSLAVLAAEGGLTLAPATRKAVDAAGSLQACLADLGPACAAAADEATDPQVAAQLRAHAAWRGVPRGPLSAPTALPAPGWVPDAAAIGRCTDSVLAMLLSDQAAGRGTFSPGLRVSTQQIADRLGALGLAVSQPEVPVPMGRVDSWVQVGEQRFPAIAVPGSAPGTFDGPVRVFDSRPSPRTVQQGGAPLLFAVSRLELAAVDRLEAPVPVLALRADGIDAVRAAGGVARGVALPSDARPTVHNAIAVLPGRGDLAAEAVVVGAHIDGYGTRWDGVVRPAADDNASGTAGMACTAESVVAALADVASHRTVVFAAFSAEELGLLGSLAYTWQPGHPLDRTVAMVNLDMIGRLRADVVHATLHGEDLWPRIVGAGAAVGLTVAGNERDQASAAGTSDHLSFSSAGVPAVHLNTGLHGDYHGSTDTADRLNRPGIVAVTRMAAGLVADLATGEAPAPDPSDPCVEASLGPLAMGYTARAYTSPSLRVRCVPPDSPAEALGLQPGDRIMGDNPWQAGRGWPAQAVDLYVERAGACLRLRAGAEAETIRCEAVP